MTKVTRNTWSVALVALGLTASELVAYQGIAPHAQGLGVSTRVALAAGRIVARDLSAFVMNRASQAAGDLALLGLKQTSNLYRLADCALATAGGARCSAGPCAAFDVRGVARDAGAAAEAERAAVESESVAAGAASAAGEEVAASEPDMPCGAAGACEVMTGGSACPPCPACPARQVRIVRSERIHVAPVVRRRIVLAL